MERGLVRRAAGFALVVGMLAMFAPESAALSAAQDFVAPRGVPSGGQASAAGTAAALTRVMPLGDSITGSPGCWRDILAEELRRRGHDNVRFVGTQPPQDCADTTDALGQSHEGHSGFRATEVAAERLLVGWLAWSDPDVVLMHFGTNDIRDGWPTAAILESYSQLLTQMRQSNPEIHVVVAQIIPMDPEACAECEQGVAALNIAIPAWAEAHSTEESPVQVVDQWTGFDPATHTRDGIHPNSAGQQRIAHAWLPTVSALLAPRGSAQKGPWSKGEDV